MMAIGKDGISSRLGSGGMSLSSETLMLAASGRQEAGKVMDWKYGTDESRSTLNGINQLGYTNIQVNHDLANDIWNEQIGVDYADIAGYGLYKVGEKSITLNSDLLGGGLEESAKLATVLSHEGTHLYGNRIEGIAHLQGATTYMQLLDQFKLAGDETFAGEIMAGLTDPSSWVENTDDEDWWKQVRRNDGSFAWQEDGSLDFNFEDGTVVAAEDMKSFISSYIIKQQSESQGIKIFSNHGTEPSNAEIAMTGVFADYLKNNSAIFPQQAVDKYTAFIIGTEAFADASITAQNVMTSIDKGESGEIINRQLNEMNSHLMKIQEGGYLVKNKVSEIDTSRLIGEGTADLPYFPLEGYFNDEKEVFVKITGYDGWRLNDKEMAGINSNYVLYEFSKYHHEGWDGVGKGNIVASQDGSIYLDYLRAEGFQVNADTGSDVFKTSHATSDTIMQYINLFGQEGRNLLLDKEMYSLEGIRAGDVIGRMGNTGANSTGAHAHMSVNGRGDLFAEKFNQPLYKNSFQADDYALYMSGYENKSFSDNLQLWSNVKKFSEARPDLLDFDDFKKQHLEDVPLIYK